MAHEHLARHLIGHIPVSFVDDPHLDARHRAAEGAGADLARLKVVGQRPHHLGHAPHLDHGEAKAHLEGGVQLRLDAGADAEAHVVAALVLAWAAG